MTTISLGNAPCSWGTLEFGSTKADRIDFDQMLDELAASGYSGSELGDYGFMPTDASALADEFRKRSLTLTGAFVGVDLRDPAAHEPGKREVLRVARLIAGAAGQLGQETPPFLVLADANGTNAERTQQAGRVQPHLMLDNEEWETFAGGAEEIARTVRQETGLRTVFHHHCAGFVETPEEIALLLDHTDPDLIGLVFDTGHFAFGAGGCASVLNGLQRFAERIWYVHFKDYDPQVGRQAAQNNWGYFEAVRHGVFCELGRGCVDFPAVIAWLRRHNYQGYITVEQDVLPGMGAPRESAERNREYLSEIGL